MPFKGEQKKAYQRAYMKRVRARVKEIKRAVLGAVKPGPGPAPTIKDEAARVALRVLLEEEGPALPKLLRKVNAAVDYKRPWGDHENPKMYEDGDVQLRAVDIGLRLHERAGTIPSERAASGPAGSGFYLHVHLDGLRPQPVVVEGARKEIEVPAERAAPKADRRPGAPADPERDPA